MTDKTELEVLNNLVDIIREKKNIEKQLDKAVEGSAKEMRLYMNLRCVEESLDEALLELVEIRELA